MSAAKLPPVTLFGGVDVAGIGQFIFGSLTSVVGHVATGYNQLPDWSDVQPDSSIRDPVKYITSEEQLQSNQGSQEERRRRSDSSDSEIHVNVSRDDDFKIFEDKTGTASISNSSEEESEGDGGSSVMSSKSSEISSSDEEDERSRRKEKKRKSNKKSRSNGGDAGLDLMSVFKKTVPTSQPVVQESSRTSNSKSKSKSKSKSVSKSRSRHDHSDSESDKLTQSSEDDEDSGDLFSALGKTSRLKKSSAPNGSKENSGTIAKAGIRKVPLANNVFNSVSSNLVGDIVAPPTHKNHMDDLEDAFGFLSTTVKPMAPTAQNVQQQSLNGRGMNINHSSNSAMTMTNNDFDALFMPKKAQTSQAQHQPQSQLHDYNLMDFGSSMNSSLSTSIITSPQTNQGKLDIPSPTSLSAAALPHPAMSLPPSVHSPPMNLDIILNGSSKPITPPHSSQLLDFGSATNPNVHQSVTPVSNVLIPTNSSIPNQSMLQPQPVINQQERVSNILTAFDGSGKATAQPSPTSYTQPVMLPNPPPISPHNTMNNGTVALKSMPLQVHPIQQPAALPPHIPTERPLEEFTDPRAIVNPAMSGGLLVSIAFRKGVKSATYIGATSLFVIIKNMKDKQPIK